MQYITDRKTKVIDASTAHRTNREWTYGIPELNPLQREKIKKLALKNFETTYKRILSIVGVGENMAASILAYYGDFKDFSNTKEIASFCGICPGIKQSGTSINGKGSITRKGNKDIRKSLYLCSLSASRYNKQCKDLYERLLLKGKSKKLALIAVGHKILRQIFGVIKNNLDFNPDYLNKTAIID